MKFGAKKIVTRGKLGNPFLDVNLASRPGCYSLIISLKRKRTVRVGKLGVAPFPQGTYVYTGSAMGGLAARLKRHLTRKKKIRWHIDHLLKLPEARVDKVIVYRPAPNQECWQNQRIAALPGAAVVLKRFGASDCKSGCASHLFFFTGFQASAGLTAEAARFWVSSLGFKLETQDSGLFVCEPCASEVNVSSPLFVLQGEHG